MAGLTRQQKKERRVYAMQLAWHQRNAVRKHEALERAATITAEHKRLLDQQLTQRPE